MDNNRTERDIKPFVIGRKNLVFANSSLGAQTSAVIFSLIETAKKTVLVLFCSLFWVWEPVPTLGHSIEHWAEPQLPANAPVFC